MSLATTTAVRRFQRERHGDSAAPGSHIEHRRRSATPPDLRQGQFDQQLRLGPWNQHAGRDLERAAVELALAQQIGARDASGALGDQRPESCGVSRRKFALSTGEYGRGRQAAGVSEQQSRFQRRFVHAGERQVARCRVEQVWHAVPHARR